MSVNGEKGAVNMKLEYGLDRFYLPTKIHIIPSKGENPDFLHNMSMKMMIENPSIDFAQLPYYSYGYFSPKENS